MEIYFGTVRRTAPMAEGGHLIRLDWDRKRVLAEVPINPGIRASTAMTPTPGEAAEVAAA